MLAGGVIAAAMENTPKWPADIAPAPRKPRRCCSSLAAAIVFGSNCLRQEQQEQGRRTGDN
jgi:hypothetical protein